MSFHPDKNLPGCMMPDGGECCVGHAAVVEDWHRLRRALEKIRDHWANQYDHPRKQNEMYRGPYGVGVTDGHRACAIIATKALSPAERGGPNGN